jgi:hypothetical protein
MWILDKGFASSALRPICEKYAKKNHIAYDLGCGGNIIPTIILAGYVQKVYAVEKNDDALKSFKKYLKKAFEIQSLPIEVIQADIKCFKSENETVTAYLNNQKVRTGLPKADIAMLHQSTPWMSESAVVGIYELMRLGGYLFILDEKAILEIIHKKWVFKGFSEVERDFNTYKGFGGSDDAYIVMQKTNSV